MGEKPSKSTAPLEGHEPTMQEGSGDVAAGMAVEAPPQTSCGNEADEPGMPNEADILAKLIAHLSSQPEGSCPLADVRKNLPPGVRKVAEDTQAISGWLQRFHGLIQIVGEPGQEQVVLALGGGGVKLPMSQPAVESPEGPPKMANAPRMTEVAVEDHGGSLALDDDESVNACTVQLRGLPFRATVQDIKNFLGYHAVGLSAKDPSIRLLLNRDGRPSGFARVAFVSAEAARAAREQLHKQPMGDRYVEVLACSERAGKMRNRRAGMETSIEGVHEVGEAEAMMAGGASEAVERERVLQECRDHMRMPGRQQILLSMLGIALSRQARLYLRRVNLGLKHFLARFPNEFRVEGPKGCEKVIWCPGGIDPYLPMMNDPMAMMNDPMAAAEATAALMASWNMSVNMVEDPETNKMLASPVPQRTHRLHCEQTPSNWGTPGSGGEQTTTAENSSRTNTTISSTGNTAGMDPAMAAFTAFGPGFGWGPPWAGNPWFGGMEMDMDGMGGKGKGGALKNKPTKGEAGSSRSHAHLHPQSHPFAHQPPGGGPIANAPSSGTAPAVAMEADNKSNVAALRLRGLPFTMDVQDVLAFFAQYDVADRIADSPQAAQLLPKANGRPSGQARVQMRSRADAEVACAALNNMWIGGRYIEVFVYGDENGEEGRDAALGWDSSGGDPSSWQKQSFPPFAPFPGAGFSNMGGPPPWALGPPPSVPGADGTSDGANFDNLFSFLYANEAMEIPGSAPPAQDAPPRNAVQV